VIFALRHPAVLLGLLVGFVIGVSVRAALQRRVAAGAGPGRGRGRAGLHTVGSARRRSIGHPAAGWAAYLDPYGGVAAVLAGVGWGARVDARRRKGADVLLLLVALAVHAAFAAIGIAAFVAVGGDLAFFPAVQLQVSEVLRGSFDIGAARDITLGFAMVNLACGVLALVPIPPMELGVVLWSRLPKSAGSRRLAFRLLEEPWGVAALLVLLLPLFGGQAPLLAAVDAAGDGVFSFF
jgi:hypothetical protein